MCVSVCMYVCPIYIDEDIESLQLSNKKSRQLEFFKKWTKDLKRYFTEEDMCMVKKRMKRYLKSLVIRALKMKTTIKYN